VLGAIAGLMMGAAGLIAGIGPLFEPETAKEEGQKGIHSTATKIEQKVDILSNLIEARFPDAHQY
jgi:hypothetical protein